MTFGKREEVSAVEAAAPPPPGDAPAEAAPQAPALVQPAPQDQMLEQLDAREDDKPSRAKGKVGSLARGLGSAASSPAVSYRQYNAEVYDPNAMVQTGPGLPKWHWSSTSVRFSGPVERSQRLHLFLLSPPVNLVLALLRACLLALLFLRLVPTRGSRLPGTQPAALGFAVLAFAVLSAPAARADVPSTEMLDQYRERLLAKPACAPLCASSSRLFLDVRGALLRGRMSVEASETTAVPLPGGAAQWLPERVLLNGKDAAGLLRTDEGHLWLRGGGGAAPGGVGGGLGCVFLT
jgi:hypothetical protein